MVRIQCSRSEGEMLRTKDDHNTNHNLVSLNGGNALNISFQSLKTTPQGKLKKKNTQVKRGNRRYEMRELMIIIPS